MSKSALTIHKEILKKKHDETPLGIIEKRLRSIYDGILLKNEKLPEDISEKIYVLRDEHEKKQLKYIEDTQKEHAKKVDEMLFDTMSAELNLIEDYLKTNGKLH